MSKTKPSTPVSANLSLQQMELAIPKIERRIVDLEQFDINSVNDIGDARVDAMERELDSFLVSIFGADTVEYQRYKHAVTNLNPNTFWPDMSVGDIRNGLARGISTSKANLESIKKGFLEELVDAGHTATGKTLKAYEGLELHPAIERAAGRLFHDGHYANAIEDSVKALNALVRMNSGVEDKDGVVLMEYVFSPKAPILRFNSLADTSDVEEQKGFMMMFSGAVSGLRNPRAHKLIKDNEEMALEFIAFISLLAKLADKSVK